MKNGLTVDDTINDLVCPVPSHLILQLTGK